MTTIFDLCTLHRKPISLLHRIFALLSLSVFLLIILCFVRIVYAEQVTLEWDPVMHPEIAGYMIYYGTSTRDYDESLDVGDWTSATIADLEDREVHYFAVTAYDLSGSESEYSNEVCINCASLNPIPISAGGGDADGGG